MLVGQGANPTTVDHQGTTTLMVAAERGNVDLLLLFFERGLQPDYVDRGGSTALVYAAAFGQFDCVRLLIHVGADPSIKNRSGRDAADYAAKYNHPELASYLRLKAQQKMGSTATRE
jgi:ankyrin repeat protein